jgi:hypothetical protein
MKNAFFYEKNTFWPMTAGLAKIGTLIYSQGKLLV